MIELVERIIGDYSDDVHNLFLYNDESGTRYAFSYSNEEEILSCANDFPMDVEEAFDLMMSLMTEIEDRDDEYEGLYSIVDIFRDNKEIILKGYKRIEWEVSD